MIFYSSSFQKYSNPDLPPRTSKYYRARTGNISLNYHIVVTHISPRVARSGVTLPPPREDPGDSSIRPEESLAVKMDHVIRRIGYDFFVSGITQKENFWRSEGIV